MFVVGLFVSLRRRGIGKKSDTPPRRRKDTVYFDQSGLGTSQVSHDGCLDGLNPDALICFIGSNLAVQLCQYSAFMMEADQVPFLVEDGAAATSGFGRATVMDQSFVVVEQQV